MGFVEVVYLDEERVWLQGPEMTDEESEIGGGGMKRFGVGGVSGRDMK